MAVSFYVRPAWYHSTVDKKLESVIQHVKEDSCQQPRRASGEDKEKAFPLLRDSFQTSSCSTPEDEMDEFGNPSNFTSLYATWKCLALAMNYSSGQAPVVVNIGARDGIGTMGNTDPTWPLYSMLLSPGLAIEASEVFRGQLFENFAPLPAKPLIATVTSENVVDLIRGHGLDSVDVLKVDIDGWDCKLLEAMLMPSGGDARSIGMLKIIMAEYNVKFPPPIKMALATRPGSGFSSCARGHIYGCSLQFMNDNIMRPSGYVLAQVDWQNALYVHASLAAAAGIPEGGIDVQEAYSRGYASRPRRAENMPWNRDVDHLIEPGISAWEAWKRAVRFVELDGGHMQDGSVLLGCGDAPMVSVDYRAGRGHGSASNEC